MTAITSLRPLQQEGPLTGALYNYINIPELQRCCPWKIQSFEATLTAENEETSRLQQTPTVPTRSDRGIALCDMYKI